MTIVVKASELRKSKRAQFPPAMSWAIGSGSVSSKGLSGIPEWSSIQVRSTTFPTWNAIEEINLIAEDRKIVDFYQT